MTELDDDEMSVHDLELLEALLDNPAVESIEGLSADDLERMRRSVRVELERRKT